MQFDINSLDNAPLVWKAIVRRVASSKAADWKVPRNEIPMNYQGGFEVPVHLFTRFREGNRETEYAFRFTRDIVTGCRQSPLALAITITNLETGDTASRELKGPRVESLYESMLKVLGKTAQAAHRNVRLEEARLPRRTGQDLS